jgi:hypothetical protein
VGFLAKLLSFNRATNNGVKVNDVKVNPGGNPNITAQHFSDPGDDSYPLPGDLVALNDDSGTGREYVAGYLDPNNQQKAQLGDKRIYGRNADTGQTVVEIWLKNDGTAIVSNNKGSVELLPNGGTIVRTPETTFSISAEGSILGQNGNGSFELAQNGDFFVNGVTIDTSGNITSPATITAPNLVGSASVRAKGKELVEHNHPAGSPPSNTGPNN